MQRAQKTVPDRSAREIEVEDGGEDRVARTERKSERRRETTDLLVLPRSAKSMQNDAGFSGKTLIIGPAEKKKVTSVPQREQLANTLESSLPKRNRAICPDHHIVRWERVKVR